MAEHTLIIEWIGIILALVFGVTMFCQGHAIFHGKYGYKHTERDKQRSADIRKQLEKIINANGHSTKED
tara:strand:- start:7 stop:213 length:207 start_codon:yes stop_codon:yes gene_type:complete